jgi:Xaa-Pro aminopeptidase
MNELARLTRLVLELRKLEIDRLLVSTPVNVRYLSGYTGSNGLLLVSAEEQVEHRFFTDFRYATQSAEEVPDCFEREIASGELIKAAADTLEPRGEGGGLARGTLGVEATFTVKQDTRLCELLAAGWELVPCPGIVERLREVKDGYEVERIRAAAALADQALTDVLEEGLAGRTERDVAIALELRMRQLGAQGTSFASIVASQEHGALPHAEPRYAEIPSGTLVTVDWGAQLDGYCSDCARTYATGRLSEQATAVYELVLRAQEAALQAVRPGIGGREVDGVARSIIEQAGYGEHFRHGVGHGVGMEVHEAPRLSRTADDELLCAGNVITVEPGIYVPGQLGVRIEDLVLVGDRGPERLTGLAKELVSVE